MEQKSKKKPIDYFSFWQLQNKITLFTLVGILLLSGLFAVAVISLPELNPTHFVVFIITIPVLACFGIATSHSSRNESAKAEREYKKIQQSLTEAEGSKITLDRFFSICSDLMAIPGRDGLLKKVSASLVNTLGYSEETLLSTPFFEFIHPDDREATIKAITSLNLGIRMVGFENRYRAADGSYRTLSWSAAADSELGVRFASARDITDERGFQNRMHQILDSAPFMLVVKDAEGTIVNCNAAYANFIGVPKEALAGRKAAHFEPLGSAGLEKEQEVFRTQKPLVFDEVLYQRGVGVSYRSTVFPILDQTKKVTSTGKISIVR